MVLKNGSVKVTDFGIARMMSKGNTLTKEALGSVHYISPEQAKGGRVDNRSDIYSLGIVMYEMMSGRPPYDGESPVAVAIQHINGGAVLPSTLNPNIPGGLEQIIMKAMAQDQTKRYDSATQMLRDMDEFRKDPAILFDYNAPREDVIKIHKPVAVPDVPEKKTTAEKVVEKKEGKSSDLEVLKRNRQRQAERRKKEEEARKRNNIALIAIISCSLVAVIAVVVFLVILLGGSDKEPLPVPTTTEAVQTIQIPSMEGKYYDALVRDPELKYVPKYVYSDEYEEGRIVSQEPAEGTLVTPGQTVILEVSKGPEPTAEATTEEPTSQATEPPELLMGDLVELTQEKAESIIDGYDIGLKIHVEQHFNDKIPAGCVIQTSPGKNTELIPNETIVLIVSCGKQPVMEDLVGKTEDEARQVFASYGLDLKLEIHVEKEFSNMVPEGQIIRTAPAKGLALNFGDKVTLVISEGVELIAKVLPAEIIGQTSTLAAETLAEIGFKSTVVETVSSKDPEGTVVGYYVQSEPEMDLTLPVDVTSTIVLQVSGGHTLTVPVTAPDEAELLEAGFLADDLRDVNGNINFVMTIVKDSQVYATVQVTSFGQTFQVDLTGTGLQTFEVQINGNNYKFLPVDFR